MLKTLIELRNIPDLIATLLESLDSPYDMLECATDYITPAGLTGLFQVCNVEHFARKSLSRKGLPFCAILLF